MSCAATLRWPKASQLLADSRRLPKPRSFSFIRPNGTFHVEKFDLKDILNSKKLDEDVTLKPGDMIVVPDSFITNFRKYVPYSVTGGAYLQPNPF